MGWVNYSSIIRWLNIPEDLILNQIPMNESTTVSRASKRRLSIISADEPDFEVQRVDGFDCILLGPHPHLYFTEFVF